MLLLQLLLSFITIIVSVQRTWFFQAKPQL